MTMMIPAIAILLAALTAFITTGEAELIYEPPEYPVQSPNMTIGGLFPLTKGPNGRVPDINGVEVQLSAICALDCFNKGKGKFSFDGVLNMISHDTTERIYTSQSAAMKLLQHNLYSSDRNSSDSNSFNTSDTKVAAIIASLSTLQYLALYPIFSGYQFPVIGTEFLGFGIPYAQFPIQPIFHPRNVPWPYVNSASATFALATAVVQLLSAMNWTLSTVLYGSDVFGMEGQTFLPNLYPLYNLTQACSTIIVEGEKGSDVDQIASCLKERQSRVVIYWSGQLGTDISLSLQEELDDSLIFIFPGNYALAEQATYYSLNRISPRFLDSFVSSFIFDYSQISPPQQCLADCLNEGIAEKLPEALLEQYWKAKFNCTRGTLDCPKVLSLSDFEPFSVTSSFDGTSLIVKSVSLIQYNCTLLNELMRQYNINGRREDYCRLETFTSSDINAILTLSLYLGYGEFLNLGIEDPNSVPMGIALYQVQAERKVAVVGGFTGQLDVDLDALYWTGGKVPVSEIPIVNPSFKYGIVAVFFSFAITGIVVAWLIGAAMVAFRKDPEIRKASPLIGFTILVGIQLILCSLIFAGFTYTRWTCFVIAWSLLLGCGLILGGMLAKMWRIYRIFTNSEAKAVQLSDAKVALITGAVVLVELVLLTLYSFPSGLLGPEVIQSTSDVYYRYRICKVPSHGYQLAWVIVIYVVNGIFVAALAVLSFLTRKIDSSYSEARSTSTAIHSVLSSLLTFLPLIYTSHNSTNSILTQYTVTGIVELLSVYCLLAAIFIPRLWPITYQHWRETRQSN